MTAGEVIQKTISDVVIERCGIEGEILFDSAQSTFRDYKAIKNLSVARIEPDSDGGRKLIRLFVI